MTGHTPVPWNQDNPHDRDLIVSNLEALLLDLIRDAPKRLQPTVAMAQEWHRRTYRHAHLPIAYYAGEVRDDDRRFPELIGYEVRVGRHQGVRSAQVPAALDDFERWIQADVATLDRALPSAKNPADWSTAKLGDFLALAATARGEWVRIHPFANCNGRTARIWANWCALRYGLPPFVRLKPRPEGLDYAAAADLSMGGDHRPMQAVFINMLLERRP